MLLKNSCGPCQTGPSGSRISRPWHVCLEVGRKFQSGSILLDIHVRSSQIRSNQLKPKNKEKGKRYFPREWLQVWDRLLDDLRHGKLTAPTEVLDKNGQNVPCQSWNMSRRHVFFSFWYSFWMFLIFVKETLFFCCLQVGIGWDWKSNPIKSLLLCWLSTFGFPKVLMACCWFTMGFYQLLITFMTDDSAPHSPSSKISGTNPQEIQHSIC